MRVLFLEDYGLDEYGNPLYIKGEIAYVLDDFAQTLIAEAIATVV